MAEFTKGPWVYSAENECIFGAESRVIVYETNTNDKDIALISAAPELYEALRPIEKAAKDGFYLKVIGDGGGRLGIYLNKEELQAVIDAIAKAEGK